MQDEEEEQVLNDSNLTVCVAPLEIDDAPAPGVGRAHTLKLMYMSHMLQTFGDRMWEFAIPVLFIEIWTHTLLPSAIFAFTLYSSTFLLMSSVGSWLDRSDRMKAMTTALCTQNACIFITSALLFFMVDLVPQSTVETGVSNHVLMHLLSSCF